MAEETRKVMGVRLPWGLITEVKATAARAGVTMEVWVEEALRGALEGRSARPRAVETAVPAAESNQGREELMRLMAAGKITRGRPGAGPREDVWDEHDQRRESDED